MVQILVDYHNKKYLLDLEAIKKFICDAISFHGQINNHSEVAWSLYLAKALKIRLEKESFSLIGKNSCSVCALLALDLRQMGLIVGDLDTSFWENYMTTAGLNSEMWLLAYEAELKGWLSSKEIDYVSKHIFFKDLKNLQVSFYDIKRKTPSIKQPASILGKKPNKTKEGKIYNISKEYYNDVEDTPMRVLT